MKSIKPWRLILLMPVALLAGCSWNSIRYVPSPPVEVPELPANARQPEPPPECLPSCLESLTKWRESTLKRLTERD